MPSSAAGATKHLWTTTAASLITDEPKAEPGPDWTVAREQWSFAWELHWLGFGLLFSLVALHSLVAIIQMKRHNALARPPIFIAVNVLLVLLGLTRAVYLLMDPYESREHDVQVPRWVSMLLFGLAYPCLSSSFCLVHLAFLEVTKLRLGSPKLHNPRFLLTIIVAHFVVVFIAEITTAFGFSRALLIVCQSFFIVWGLVLSVSFIYSGSKIIRQRASTRRQLAAASGAERTGASVRHGGKTSNISKVAKITLATSVLGLVCCALQIYSLFGVYGLYTVTKNVYPWPWWIFQTSFRLTEFAMAATLAFSIIQPAELKGRRGQLTTLPEMHPTGH